MIKSFRNMDAWKKANIRFHVESCRLVPWHLVNLQPVTFNNGRWSRVFELTKELPRSEDYGLTSQIRRSANSISANISEGFGRRTKKDKRNFYIVARGSAFIRLQAERTNHY